MIYVGIDVHKSFLQVAAVDGGGRGSVAEFFLSPRFTKRQLGA